MSTLTTHSFNLTITSPDSPQAYPQTRYLQRPGHSGRGVFVCANPDYFRDLACRYARVVNLLALVFCGFFAVRWKNKTV